MFAKTHIRKHQRGLLFRDGDFRKLLLPGDHRVWGKLWNPLRTQVEVHSTLDTLFKHPLLEVLLREPVMQAELLIVDLTDAQRALVWRDGRLGYILGPGKHALWKTPFDLRVEVFDVAQLRLAHPRLETILAHPDAPKWLDGVTVEPGEEVLLFLNSALVERLGAGRHVFWKHAGRLTWKVVDLREQTADVAGQEIMTADKVTLRVNLVVTFQVTDPLLAVSAVADHTQTLYREAQLALRAAVGGRTLDQLLADKEALGGELRAALTPRAAELGIAVKSVGLRDVILPGEMKAILNQVITAEKQAQANLIKRREETAAARSQANTAKLLAENPMLAKIKELELLQEILAGTKATFVFGDGDIAKRVRGLVGAGDAGDKP